MLRATEMIQLTLLRVNGNLADIGAPAWPVIHTRLLKQEVL